MSRETITDWVCSVIGVLLLAALVVWLVKWEEILK